MKKILIMSVAIVVSTIINAATCNWYYSATNIKGYDANNLSVGTTINLYMVVDEGKGSLVDSYTVTTAGKIDKDSADARFTTESIEGASYQFYLQFEDGGRSFVSPLEKYVSQVSTTADTGAFLSFGNMSSATKNSDNWKSTSEGVPEPTSALLAMLGLAGLALRRKQK